MAKPLLSDELWEIIEPILPKHQPSPRGGRPPVENRKALTGIIFVLKTGIPWEDLPQEMGCGCGMTCWRRLRDWQRAGVWDRVKQVLLDRLREADKLDFSRATVDAAYSRAFGGGEKTGPNPTDRGKRGSKHHVVTDATGVPLNTSTTAANQHDVTQLLPLIDGIPPVAGKPGRPRQRPDEIYADRAYDSQPHRIATWFPCHSNFSGFFSASFGKRMQRAGSGGWMRPESKSRFSRVSSGTMPGHSR